MGSPREQMRFERSVPAADNAFEIVLFSYSGVARPIDQLDSHPDQSAQRSRGHCQLSGPRAPFSGLARLERGSRIGEQGLVSLNNQSKKSGRN